MYRCWTAFESSVNPEGIQTVNVIVDYGYVFESSVNPEGIQTYIFAKIILDSLRVV